MLKKLQRALDIYFSKKKIIRKCKKLGNNIIINDLVKVNSKTEIGNNVLINGLVIREQGPVKIGSNISFAKGTLLLTGNHNYKEALPYSNNNIYKEIIIEDNVWIGQNVTILGGVTIGEGAIIQAGSVVSKSIPPLAIAGGNPCIPFKYRDEKEYNELKNSNKINIFTHRKKYIIKPIK